MSSSTRTVGRTLFNWAVPIIILLVGFPLACVKQSSTSTPQQPVSIEKQVYADLLTAQAALEGFKEQFGSMPAVKPQLNKAIAAYNLAEQTFEDYERTKTNQAELLSLPAMIADLKAKITEVQTVFGKQNPQPLSEVH